MSLTMVICLLVLYKTSGLINGLNVSVAQSKLSVSEGSKTTLMCIVKEAGNYYLSVNWHKCPKLSNNCASASRVGGRDQIWYKKDYPSSSHGGRLIWKTDGNVFNLTFMEVLNGTAGNYCCLAQTWYRIALGPIWHYYKESKAMVELLVINHTKSTHGSSIPDKQVGQQTTCQADEDNQDNINYAELDMRVLGRCQEAPKVTVNQESSGLYARVYEKSHTGAY
ncbi:uncharacterized protein LOC133345222 isoform X2 [Lethenteron reissneri]|uniref:uncharacterized protein LOC133345222 isoform X2 n=1 Tax=Lethenteron reissneri TaxID=7753 RepID=UPI002AB7927F|nr:uncharacterized protein LOC133345222 isoform X2 [Lethenteron reissneri]